MRLARDFLVLPAALCLAACGEINARVFEDAGVESEDARVGAEDASAPEAQDAGQGVDAQSAEPPDAETAVADAEQAPPDAATPAGPDAQAPVVGPILYPADRTQSPITESVAQNLRRIAAIAPRTENVFAKVGASNTVNTNHLHCFAGANVDLDGRGELQPALDFFKAGAAAGTTPFNRTSLAATVGWSAWAALAGTPNPLAQETAAITPRYASILFGTNDIQARDVDRYGQNLLDIADQLIAEGTVPLFTDAPPRDDDAAADAWVPRYAAVMRAVAQARQVPFVDLRRELLDLPDHGIGSDGLHLNVYLPSGSARGCVLTAAGLDYGHNMRNLLTLTALARARDAVEGKPAPDGTAPVLAGKGDLAEPFVIASLPFTDYRDTSKGGFSRIDQYTGCTTTNEGGPEFLYKLVLAKATNLRAFVISLDGCDVDIHLLGAAADAASCIARNDKLINQTLQPGTYFLSLDTYVASGVPKPGAYLLVVMAE
ncbi:MAG: GDSL-type esterase/lipase family protein [Myxococcales bacterium]